MRSFGWTPSIVPDASDLKFDLVRLRHGHRAIDYATSLVEHREFLGTRKQLRKALGEVLDDLAYSSPACD